jgi:hypothetical protein
MQPPPDPLDRPVQALRHEWFVTAGVFLFLIAVAVLVSLRSSPEDDTGLLIGVAALGVLLFKLGDMLVIAIGELRRRPRA